MLRSALAAFALALPLVGSLTLSLPGAAHAQSPTSPPAPVMGPWAEPMDLDDGQVESFLEAMEQLHELGLEASGRGGAGPEAFAEAVRTNAEARGILERHGFSDPAAFQRVGWNTFMAYGVLEQGGPEKVRQSMAEARQKQEQAMAQMRQHLPPEQVEAMAAQMKAGLEMAEALQDVPPGNVEVVERHRDRIAALGKR